MQAKIGRELKRDYKKKEQKMKEDKKEMMKGDRFIAMQQAKNKDSEHGSAVVIIPKYKYNTDLHCYEEDDSRKPSDKLYLKVGYNDLSIVKEMKDGNDDEKRKNKTLLRKSGS